MLPLSIASAARYASGTRFPRAPVPAQSPAKISSGSLSSPRRDPSLQPSLRYMALLIAGALEHGLPDEYVAALRAVPAVEESAEAAALRPLIDAAMKRNPR